MSMSRSPFISDEESELHAPSALSLELTECSAEDYYGLESASFFPDAVNNSIGATGEDASLLDTPPGIHMNTMDRF